MRSQLLVYWITLKTKQNKMKKLNEFGKILTRKEMKSIAGGFHQCVEGYVCGPPCPEPENNTGQTYGAYCEGGMGGPCKPMICAM